jgi:YidC/Oxa1 family membrane protein insertase
MDKQDTLRNLLFAGLIFFGIMLLAPRLFNVARPPAPVSEGTSGLPKEPSTTAAGAGLPGAREPSAAVAGGYSVVEADEVRTERIGADLSSDFDPEHAAPYRMQLTLSNIGASIESARMSDHTADVANRERYPLLSPVASPDGKVYRSLAVENVNIDDVDVRLDDKLWNLRAIEPYEAQRAGTDESGQKAEFWIEIRKEAAPVLRVVRTLRLPQQPEERQRHDLYSDITIENLSDRPHRIVLTYRGGVGLVADGYRGSSRVADYGVAREDGTVVGAREYLTKIAAKPEHFMPLFNPSQAPGSRLSWAATGNQYFTCTVAPLGFDGSDNPPFIASVEAVDLDANEQTAEDVTVRLITSAASVDAGAAVTYPAELYLGEKAGEAFKEIPKYASRNYYFQIAAGFGSCTFTWLVEVMIWLLNSLHAAVPDFGVAILILVVIVRSLLHPITKKGQINIVRMQQKMADFAPAAEELKRKYANDKARLQQETMKLYREHGINPIGQIAGCLPMILQMPIWIALFLSLSNNVRIRHEGTFFLPWIHDLTAPDALLTFSNPLPLIGDSFNLLPILVAIFMYIQQKTQPKPKPNPNASEQQRMQQETMQKMMPLMSFVMLFIFYTMPAGLNLYIMCSSFFGWMEQTYIRKHIKERQDADTSPYPKGGADAPLKRKKRAGEMSFIEKLQKLAEDAQKARPRKPAKKSGRR